MVELLVVLSLVTILALLAVPSWQRYIEKQNIRGAATTLLSDLNLLRSEAIQRNKRVTIHFSTGTAWCYGLSEDPAQTCNCTSAPQTCTIGGVVRLTTAEDFKQVQLLSTTFVNDKTGFEPTRGMAVNTGSLLLRSSSGYNVVITLNPVGRIAACANDSTLFPPC
ncbi:MAG: GspH/FimT family pseudopilin [Magnetococcales bacterium]|nr:GspH/FimT family pseudopilin [Magnetococcales bacterium]